MARELGDPLARLEAPAFGPQALDQPGGGLEQREIPGNRRLDPRPQYLDRDLAAVLEGGEMDLRDRGARHRLALESRERLLNLAADACFDFGPRGLPGKRGPLFP